MRVLIVDDDKDFAELLEMDFNNKGCDVVSAANAAEALSLLSIHYVDAIVADMYMPGQNGLELLRHVKGLLPAIPVFLVTGSVAAIKAAAQAAMADGVFSKPEQLRDLVTVVTNACLKGKVAAA